MAGKRGRSGPPGNNNSLEHGLHHYKRMLSGDGLKRSTALYHALQEREQELALALGGDPSPQERVIIADTVKTMLYIGSLDSYLAGLKHIVRKGKVHGVLLERTRLAAHLREDLKTLGLKRVPPPHPSLAEMLVEDEEEQGDNREAPTDPAECPKEEDHQECSSDGGTHGDPVSNPTTC